MQTPALPLRIGPGWKHQRGNRHGMRLHLAQVFYNPAYFDAPLDYLAEPTDGKFLLPEMGHLRDWGEVNGLLVELKGSTTSHLVNKLHAIALWSAGRKAD